MIKKQIYYSLTGLIFLGLPALSYSKANAFHDDAQWTNTYSLQVFSNFSTTSTLFKKNEERFIFDIHHNYKKKYGTGLMYERYFYEPFAVYVKQEFKKEYDKHINQSTLGVEYSFPHLVKTNLSINTHDELIFALSGTHPLTNKLSFDWKWDTGSAYFAGLSYQVTKHLSLSSNYDSDEKLGAGFSFAF